MGSDFTIRSTVWGFEPTKIKTKPVTILEKKCRTNANTLPINLPRFTSATNLFLHFILAIIGAAPFYDPLVCRDPRIYCHILDINLHLHHYYFHGCLEHVSPISFANRSEVTTPTRKLVGLRTVVLFNTSTHNLFVKSRLSLKCVISLLIITCIYLCNYFIPCYTHSNILLHFASSSLKLIGSSWLSSSFLLHFNLNLACGDPVYTTSLQSWDTVHSSTTCFLGIPFQSIAII